MLIMYNRILNLPHYQASGHWLCLEAFLKIRKFWTICL